MALHCSSRWTTVTMLLIGSITLSTCLAEDMTLDQQKEYLKQFAYLGDHNPDPHMQALQDDPEKQFHLAIQSFQRFAGLPVTGVVDNATVHMMKMPRCGVADMETMGSVARRRKRFAPSGKKWDKLHLTYRFVGPYTPDLPRSTVRRVFEDAFAMWSDVSVLSFEEISSQSDIEISFAAREHGDGSPFDGPGNTLAHAYFPNYGIGGDAHFDEDELWTDGKHTGTNLLQVAVHELGHSLGLGHSDVQSSIMAPFYRGYNPGFTLDEDDINGIRYLYGHGSGGRPTTLGPHHTTPSHGPTPPPPPPGYCPLQGFCRSFDAIDVIDDVIHAFKGSFYARLSRYGSIVDIRRIQDTWPSLPTSLDAVMSTGRYVYFFKGSKYWRMDKRSSASEEGVLVERPIHEGFPGAPDNLDAAFIWSGNGRIYFIKGGQYYRYRGSYGVDPEYPLPLYIWKGVQRPVDDVFRYDDVTYFFSGTGYQVFDDDEFEAGYPRSTKDLMQCCITERELLAQYVADSSVSTMKSVSVSHFGFTLCLATIVSALM